MVDKVKETLLPLGFAAWGLAIWAFSISRKTDSALHEIEALLLVLIGAILVVGASIVRGLERVEVTLEEQHSDE